MRWVTSAEEARYMRGRQEQNKERYSAAEEWMAKKLESTGYKWTRQAMWGYRLFDFWCHELGVAVEVDGPEHDTAYDEYRDLYNWCRSAIEVLRVRNFNEDDAWIALQAIDRAEPWRVRKARVKPGKAMLKRHGMEVARSAKDKIGL